MKYSKSGIIVCLRCFYHLLFISPMEYFNTSQPSQCRSPRVPHCIGNLRYKIVDMNQIEIIFIFVNSFLKVPFAACIIYVITVIYYQVYYIGKSAAIFHNLKINNCDVRFFLINLETQFAKKEGVIYNQKDASHGPSFYLSKFGF